jgi:chloride channel 3/4/5
MSQDEETANFNEQTHLLDPRIAGLTGHRRGSRAGNGTRPDDSSSIISSHLSKEEEALGGTAVGERLPYNDYTTIDWLHDLVRAPI